MTPMLKWMPLIVGVSLALGGCGRSGYYYDRNSEYTQAEMVEPLQLPDVRDPTRYQDAMPVPEANSDYLAAEDFDAPRPEPLAARRDTSEAFVEVREAGDDHWLLVNAAPGSVWPRLQRFVNDHGLEVTGLDAANGRIETAQGALSVRQGLRAGTSEVRCQTATDAATQCLNALKGYLAANDEAESGVSLAAQTLSRNDRVRLENHDGQWQLQIALDFERAWSELYYQLQNAFDSDNQRLVDQNRSAGEFLVEYVPREARSSGFFGSLFGGGAEPRQYRLQVTAAGQNMTTVSVAGADGDRVASGEARELLDSVASTLR
ncbi:outer membrane protein assembly factor BamC [Halomonas shantousis]